uniref:Reverse transcriptase domain-containing protein n=1 Tax=Astyanax mexicanus TaxID=7994 RepID=A0A3B1K4B1_ASTMX
MGGVGCGRGWMSNSAFLQAAASGSSVRVWPEGSSEALQDCFSTTDWNMFREAATHNNSKDIQEYTETVSAYITKCTDDVTDLKTVTVRANQKPWLTGEVHKLLKARNAAFRTGDQAGLRSARANLSRGIRKAKRLYSKKISQHFSDSRDTQNLWQGIQSITGMCYNAINPQGCVLSPLLFTLLTHDCTPAHTSNLFVKFADDTTVVGLISNNDESHYRSEVSRLASWCKHNNLSLNTEKTKEIVVDFRRTHTLHTPLFINGTAVERVSSTKFLGVHVTEDLSWSTNSASLARKANQRLYFLRKLKRAGAPTPIMTTFYRGAIESILTSCFTVWYGACTASCRRTLQRIVRAAEKIVGTSLPSLQDLYSSRLTRKALRLAGDPSHPLHSFFILLPSGRRLRSLGARTSRLRDSPIHQAVRMLNSLPALPPIPILPQHTLTQHPDPPTNKVLKLCTTMHKVLVPSKRTCTTQHLHY